MYDSGNNITKDVDQNGEIDILMRTLMLENPGTLIRKDNGQEYRFVGM